MLSHLFSKLKQEFFYSIYVHNLPLLTYRMNWSHLIDCFILLILHLSKCQSHQKKHGLFSYLMLKFDPNRCKYLNTRRKKFCTNLEYMHLHGNPSFNPSTRFQWYSSLSIEKQEVTLSLYVLPFSVELLDTNECF